LDHKKIAQEIINAAKIRGLVESINLQTTDEIHDKVVETIATVFAAATFLDDFAKHSIEVLNNNPELREKLRGNITANTLLLNACLDEEMIKVEQEVQNNIISSFKDNYKLASLDKLFGGNVAL
jgi:hypothetical protein